MTPSRSGDPIPRADLSMPPARSAEALTALDAGSAGRLVRVRSQDADTLGMLSRLGLELGTTVVVVEQSRRGVRIDVDGSRYLLPIELASELWLATEASR